MRDRVDVGEIVRYALASAATGIIALLLWHSAVTWLALPPEILPGPRQVLSALHSGWIAGTFWPHAAFTLKGALGGCAIGAAAGVAAGIVVAESRTAFRIFYPVVIAIQSMPIVAIAPLVVVYLGIGLASKIATVGLLCFFPVFVNTAAGIRAADPQLVDLYRAASASRGRQLLDVKIPAAASSIFAGVQIALVLSFIGAVVAEFVASRAGLGYLIKQYANDLNVAVMFACIVSLAVIGGALGFLLSRLRDRVVFWHG